MESLCMSGTGSYTVDVMPQSIPISGRNGTMRRSTTTGRYTMRPPSEYGSSAMTSTARCWVRTS